MMNDIIRFLEECPWASFGIFLILITLAGNLPFANISRPKSSKTTIENKRQK